MKVVTSTVKMLKVTVTAGQNGKFKPSTKLKPREFGALRQISITGDNHNANREISVLINGHGIVDHLADAQAYETAAFQNPETAPGFTQNDEIDAEVYVPVGAEPAANTTYYIAIDYWIVIP